MIQFVALYKNEDAQNYLCIKFKTILTSSGKLGRTQVYTYTVRSLYTVSIMTCSGCDRSSPALS